MGSVRKEYNSSDTTWQKVARLTASDGNGGEKFGFSADISGDYIVVGSPGDDDDGYHSGSVYVFTKPVDGWVDMTETAKLKPFDGDTMNNFGKSIAIHGETLLVGAPGENQSTDYPGYAYHFDMPSTGWEDVTGGSKMSAPDGVSDDYFGVSVAVTGEVIVISAPGKDGKGAAYVYTKSIDEWTYSGKLKPYP
ncbi:MAG: FG-GAP repeat protein [Bacteroidota bacterium]